MQRHSTVCCLKTSDFCEPNCIIYKYKTQLENVVILLRFAYISCRARRGKVCMRCIRWHSFKLMPIANHMACTAETHYTPASTFFFLILAPLQGGETGQRSLFVIIVCHSAVLFKCRTPHWCHPIALLSSPFLS